VGRYLLYEVLFRDAARQRDNGSAQNGRNWEGTVDLRTGGPGCKVAQWPINVAQEANRNSHEGRIGIEEYPYAYAMDHEGLSESCDSISEASSTRVALKKVILVAGLR
jgi:hypothetical protein